MRAPLTCIRLDCRCILLCKHARRLLHQAFPAMHAGDIIESQLRVQRDPAVLYELVPAQPHPVEGGASSAADLSGQLEASLDLSEVK